MPIRRYCEITIWDELVSGIVAKFSRGTTDVNEYWACTVTVQPAPLNGDPTHADPVAHVAVTASAFALMPGDTLRTYV